MPAYAKESQILDVSIRLTIPQMKKQVFNQDVLSDMITLAKTGLRIRVDKFGQQEFSKDGKPLFEQVSTKDMIECQKFLLNRILPPARETVEVSEDYSRWLTHTELEQSPRADMPPAQRDEARAKALAQ